MSNKEKTVCIYCRVSTTDKQSIEMQQRELEQYCDARGWKATVYQDACSGAKDSRNGLNRMMQGCRDGKHDIVLCWKLDRLSRSLKQLLIMLDEFNTLGIGFVSLKDAIDMTSSTGKLLFSLIGAFAEFERDIIRTRVKSGLDNARAKGVKLGRKPIAPVLQDKIIELHKTKTPMREIAKKLKVSHGAVFTTIQKFKQDNQQVA